MFSTYIFIHVVSISLAYYVLSLVTIGNWASILSMGVIMSIPLAAVWLKQPMTTLHVVCLLFSLAGMMLIVKPDIFFGENTVELEWYQYVCIIVWLFVLALEFVCYAKLNQPLGIILCVDAACASVIFG